MMAAIEPKPEPESEKSTLFPKITGKLDEFITNISNHPCFSESAAIHMVGTVKLHGSHSDVVIYYDNSIIIQSRNQRCLGPGKNDVFGMSSFLTPLRSEFLE
jgi:hypothetical protein